MTKIAIAAALLIATVLVGVASVSFSPFGSAIAWTRGPTLAPSGRIASESRPTAPFTAVAFALPGQLVLRQGPVAPLAIEADDNLLGEIESVVEDGKLKLRLRGDANVSGRPRIRIVATAPELKAVSIAGSGDVIAEPLKAGDFSVSIAGSGDARFEDLRVDALTLSIAGSGDFKATGRTAKLAARIAGSGDIDASRLEARQASVAIAGSGDARVWATESLSASVAGSGDVRYYGDAKLHRTVVGSGEITRMGSAP